MVLLYTFWHEVNDNIIKIDCTTNITSLYPNCIMYLSRFVVFLYNSL